MAERPYYEAYDERYRIAHAAGVRWMGDEPSPIVRETLEKYGVSRRRPILELGCGEGRDAEPLLADGYDLLATDVSPEAIRSCRQRLPAYAARFQTLDFLKGSLERRFAFIYAIAVLHMLVPDSDRAAFYRFIREHLEPGGLALIGSMGDGEHERQSDIRRAFELQERESGAGVLRVPSTSCRIVGFPTLERELTENGLQLVERGLCSMEPQFDRMMTVVVRQA